ncbi:MAG: hypothetical protein MH472_07940 [Bacteroidia bacterium]|nr:hypothetical protein [Bacteroidia bacterium]
MASLLEESMIRSRKETMISFLHQHPEYLAEALELCIQDHEPFCWRSAWILQNFLQPNSPEIRELCPKILAVLPKKKDGHQRELLKLLKLVNLTEEWESQLYDICFNIWIQLHKSPSVRYTALEYLLDLVKKYPELLHELEMVLEDEYLETLSPGIGKMVRKRLHLLKKKLS